jgi:hypothetical protein
MIFEQGKIKKTYDDKSGLSSMFVRKVLRQDDLYMGVNRSRARSHRYKNRIYHQLILKNMDLSNTIVNDFVIIKWKNIVCHTIGYPVCNSLPQSSSFKIKFPLLKATSNGKEVFAGNSLQGKQRDITFYFEALHYLSSTAMVYHYRLKGLDTIWRTANNFSNQLAFNQLHPGNTLLR